MVNPKEENGVPPKLIEQAIEDFSKSKKINKVRKQSRNHKPGLRIPNPIEMP
jgi:hypothetical protein